MRGTGVRKGMQVFLCVERGNIIWALPARQQPDLFLFFSFLISTNSLISNHEFDHLSPHHRLYCPCANMGPQKTFSKLFKKVKSKLTRDRRKQEGGSGTDQGRGETEVEGREVSQRSSHPHPEVKDGVHGEPSREGYDVGRDGAGRVDPPTSTPLISHSGEADGM